MLRVALALIAFCWLWPSMGLAQVEPDGPVREEEQVPAHAPPPRLERPPPRPLASQVRFTLSMAANIRLQALGLGLGDLAERERTRFLPAGLQVGFALGLGVAAVFIQDPGLRAALSLASAVNTARGVLQLSMSAHVGRAAEEFAGIEANNKAALFRKLHVGELGLAQAARVGKRQRIIAGCLGVVGAAGYLPLQLVLARRQDPGYRFGTVAGDYVGLSLSLIGLARSLVQALIKTPAERHYSEYRVLRRETMALP